MKSGFLRVISGARQGLSVPLLLDRPLVIGRRSGDLIFDDAMVSSKHCIIEFTGKGFRLTDLGSTNGTSVDGRQVREKDLIPGMEIGIGQSRLVIYEGEEPTVSSRPPEGRLDVAWLLDEELVEVRSSRDKTDAIGQDLRLPPGVSALVEIVAGQDAGKVFRFSRGNVTLGRKTGEVPLNDVEVSRHHAVIELFGREMIFLRDLGSTNGTYHNGRRIRLSRIRSGDTIACGKTVMKLQVSR